MFSQSGRSWFDSWRPQSKLVEGTRFTMMTDPIADMLTRIRNAVSVERPNVEMPSSKVKRGIADVLKREGYIWDWAEEETQPARSLRIDLKYGPNGERVLQKVRRVSKPGRRVYQKATDLRPVLNGMGITIISTSHGVVSDREARQKNIGGEILAEVY
jgi:small subunit ribosomal protein S8